MKKNIEILAPAGAFPQLEAAVKCGADAVYFGASAFNARRNAVNFTDEEFIEAVRYCHKRDVKAYITFNTIVKDTELADMENTLALIARSGADAVIVQDMAVAETVKKCCPSLALHASTQMAVHNVSGAKILERAGFSRIVLARELSIKEIKKICSEVNAEIEVFVHGAHCMSASGMCYMSSALGGRSGNRGLCAQPCRLNFKYNKREYALSLKDMCLADHIDELIDAGAASLKIEGRMKRPEYVGAAVKAYKDALNGKNPDIETLKSVFSRSGFTDGYATGRRDLSMFGYRTKDDVMSSADVLPSLAALYNGEKPLVEISMEFEVKQGKPALLTLSCGKDCVKVTGAVPEKAMKLPLTSEMAEKSLLKLGSTYFYCNNIKSYIEPGLMLRASDINAMRREACEKLDSIRGELHPHKFTPYENKIVSSVSSEKPELRLMFRNVSQIPENTEADRIILPAEEIENNTYIIDKYKDILCAALPSLIYPADEEKYKNILVKLKKAGVKYAYCDNIGAVEIAENSGMTVNGGALLNILNSRSIKAYEEMEIKDITLSSELSLKHMKNIKTSVKTGMIIYGYMPLMHFRCCPMQGKNGCAGCTGDNLITDRRGEHFRVLCSNKKYSVLHNCVPLYAGDKNLPELDFYTLVFTSESAVEAALITECAKNKKALPGKKTAGLYDKELL